MMASQFNSVDELIAYINTWFQRGDITKVCKKTKYDSGNLSRMLEKKIGPNFDVLKECKKIADENYAKVN